tara:strand:+ start:1192 stop:3096 length:1905 start_codon:yes stop_codon:yes gene_type:complete
MATKESFIPFRSPFTGVSSLPQRHAQGGFAALSVNVDTSQGVIRSRPGYSVIYQATSGVFQSRTLGIASTLTSAGEARIIWVYYKSQATKNWGEIRLSVHLSNGAKVKDLTLNQSPYDVVPGPYEFPCFVDYMGSVYIIFKKGCMYKYDTESDDVTKVIASNITRSEVFPYFQSIPDGTIAEAHGRRLFMAGFDGIKTSSVTTNIPEDQNFIPESVIDASRASVVLPQNAIAFSDFDDPTVWKSTNLLAAPKGQKITGLASTDSELLVFTEQTVNVVRGFHEQSMQITTIAQGVGCVSQRTIAYGQGVTCWMSHNGWYMYSGGRVQKISNDIGDIFRLEGWREIPMRRLGSLASEYQFPLCVDKANLWQACGGYDFARGAFMWSIPMLGRKDWNGPGAFEGHPAKINNMTLVFYPSTGTWDMWAPSKGSGFFPESYTSVLEGSNQFLVFGTAYGHLCTWGTDVVDKKQELISSSAIREGIPDQIDENDATLTWFWMSPRLEPAANIVSSVKSVRVRQRAVGYAPPTDTIGLNFHLETERSFDQEETQLSAVGYIDGSPDTGPPSPKVPDHYWNNGKWDEFKWAGRDVWKAKYNVTSIITGHTFRVGFSETIDSNREFMEIHGFDIEVQPRRDIT